jgi:DNA (cytosine-5)-methyltransferase 1
MENGFSARVIDTNHITPFMKRVSFPAMAESGWKTNTLAIDLPYDLNYPGVIKPPKVKETFLRIVDKFQSQGENPQNILLYMFALLIKQRDNLRVELAKPHSLSIIDIVALLENHFSADYKNISGDSRLPTLAVYAAYQCMMTQVERYKSKTLCPLENHNSADARSGRIGDVDINNSDGTTFEGVEIKHGIQIKKQSVTDAYEKFKVHNTNRYYLLTTANMDNADWTAINTEIRRISHIHGCQVIVNGVYSTLGRVATTEPARFLVNFPPCRVGILLASRREAAQNPPCRSKNCRKNRTGSVVATRPKVLFAPVKRHCRFY